MLSTLWDYFRKSYMWTAWIRTCICIYVAYKVWREGGRRPLRRGDSPSWPYAHVEKNPADTCSYTETELNWMLWSKDHHHGYCHSHSQTYILPHVELLVAYLVILYDLMYRSKEISHHEGKRSDVCMYAGSVKYTYKTILYMHNITYNVMDCTVNPEIFV